MKQVLLFLLITITSPPLSLLGQSSLICKIDINKSEIAIKCRQKGSTLFDISASTSDHMDSLSLQFYRKIKDLNIRNNSFFLYCHSLYGSSTIYSDIAQSVIQENILKGTGIPLMIVEWDSWNPLYGKNQEIAKEKGKLLTDLLRHFYKNQIKISSLHHSMGAQLLPGMLENMSEEDSLSKVFMVAPDLDNNFVEKNSTSIKQHIRELHIFYSSKDVVLWLSQWLNQKERLGNQVDSFDLRNVYLHDTNDLSCFLKNNHINWLTCPEIRKTLRKELIE